MRGGDGNRGGEDSRGCGRTETGGVWDQWSLTTSRPFSPTLAHRYTERAGLRVAVNGAG